MWLISGFTICSYYSGFCYQLSHVKTICNFFHFLGITRWIVSKQITIYITNHNNILISASFFFSKIGWKWSNSLISDSGRYQDVTTKGFDLDHNISTTIISSYVGIRSVRNLYVKSEFLSIYIATPPCLFRSFLRTSSYPYILISSSGILTSRRVSFKVMVLIELSFKIKKQTNKQTNNSSQLRHTCGCWYSFAING